MLGTHAYALPIDGNIDVSGLNYMNARTPGKSILKTPGRTLHKSRSALQENVAYDGNGGTTARKKGKGHTPFHPAIRAGFEGPTVGSQACPVVTRVLGDKTPAPNRHLNYQPMQTPAPQTIKLAKLSILETEEEDFMMPTPGAYLRPSSSRKSLRASRTSGSGQKMLFKTPATNGRHWEVNEEDLQIMQEAEPEPEVEVDDYDEIEYMPPKVSGNVEQPYEPPFDMPDYKVMGKALLLSSRTDPVDETLEWKYARPIEEEINDVELLDSTGALVFERPELPDLSDEEDPFLQFLPKPAPSNLVPSKPGLSRTIARSGPPRPTTAPGIRPLVRSATISNPRTTVSKAPTDVALRAAPAPRTTSNTPAPGSTSTSTRAATAAAIRRPMTSTGVRAAVTKPSKPVGPAFGSSSSRTATGPVARSTSTASQPLARTRVMTAKPTATPAGTRTTTSTRPVAPSAPLSRTRSATVTATSTSRTPSNLKTAHPVEMALIKIEVQEEDDFAFDV
ncbi:hypothetical protein EIP91_010470 [Steccherinum ochraceum]|uniref:Uncharacterized protein n=1 Tax=Steccherinum ochraceum TaxID=92696 RepID=A0A4R0RQQ7_9APHY|nr:hypothetical protein EIP91_010470 [Steccherinum ochraceum]